MAVAQATQFSYWGALPSFSLQAFGFGSNIAYQLGNNSIVSIATPTTTISSSAAWTAISAGFQHTCGITNGTVYCWGSATYGRLGNNTSTVTSTTPQPIYQTTTGWQDVTSGMAHSCGIRNGQAYCWGNNGVGQIGVGSTAISTFNTPQEVAIGGVGWNKLSAGQDHSCGIRNGQLYCWGYDASGQMGDGTATTGSASPTLVSATLDGWTDVSAGGSHSCGINSSQAFCWGDGSNGRLGGGNTTARTFPYPLTGIGAHVGWSKISAGLASSCGIISNTAYCWGLNSSGQVGNGTLTDANTPALVSGGWTDWTDISAGKNYACGVRSGYGYCWGENIFGNLGIPAGPMGMPQQVSLSASMSTISAASIFACGISSGTAYCWGDNSDNQLGDLTSTLRNAPTAVNGTTGWTRISVNKYNTTNGFACGIRGGGAYCWGANNAAGWLGWGGTAARTSPSAVAGGFTNWTEINPGYTHACGIRGGAMYCWGNGSSGQIGISSTTTNNLTPALVSGSWTDWTKISSGNGFSCGIRGTGIAYCWGAGTQYKLGNNSTATFTTPTLVLGGWTDWTDIAAGDSHGCGLRSTGIAYCWGNVSSGRVGTGTASAQSPTIVAGGWTDWTKISAGFVHSCGIRSGIAYCWGDPTNSALGNMQITGSYTTPTLVAGGYTDWTDISAGYRSSCGVRNNTGYCWGPHASGQSGVGIDFTVPQPVTWSTYVSLTHIRTSSNAATTFALRVSP